MPPLRARSAASHGAYVVGVLPARRAGGLTVGRKRPPSPGIGFERARAGPSSSRVAWSTPAAMSVTPAGGVASSSSRPRSMRVKSRVSGTRERGAGAGARRTSGNGGVYLAREADQRDPRAARIELPSARAAATSAARIESPDGPRCRRASLRARAGIADASCRAMSAPVGLIVEMRCRSRSRRQAAQLADAARARPTRRCRRAGGTWLASAGTFTPSWTRVVWGSVGGSA